MFFLYAIPITLALDIQHETYRLDNGLSVILIEDHSIPQVVVDTWYHVGSYDDPVGASGFAHLFEHLMFMGTERIPQGEFDGRMEEFGGWNNATTGADYTNYYDVAPSELLDLLLFMEADRMVGLDITQRKLDLQRDVVRNERRQNYEDRSYGSVWLVVPEMMYPGNHPYHLDGIGSHEDLKAATLETVQHFYRDWYMPNNATLCVAGDFDPTTIKEKIQFYFGQIPERTLPERIIPPIPTKPQESSKTIYDRIQVPAVIMTWHSPPLYENGDAALDVLADVLSGGNDARFDKEWINAREEVQEFSVFQMSSQKSSLFMVQAYARPGTDLEKLAKELQQEITAIANGSKPVSAEELNMIQSEWEMNFYWKLESNLGRAETLQTYLFHTGDSNYIQKDLNRYLSLQIGDLQRAAATYLREEQAAILYVLPEETK